MSSGFDGGTLQHHLSLGLAHIRLFLDVDTPQARHDLRAPSGNKRSNVFFLAHALEESNIWGEVLSTLDSDEEDEYISKPWYSEPDPGPEDVWRWTNYSQPVEEFIFSPSQAPLREWCYVMWDRDRLDEWNVFDKPWEPLIDRDEFERQRSSRIAEEQLMFETRARMRGFPY